MSFLQMIAGIEELEATAGLVEEVTEAVEEVVKTELAEVTAEVQEVQEVVEEISEEIEEIEEAVEDVQESVEGLESMLNSGSYNAQAFALIYAQADARASKIPGYRSQGGRLGAESLGDASTAQIMARNGMESMMDTVKSWGRKAADFIRALFNSVINFFKGLRNQSVAIESRADSLIKRLDKATIKDEVKLGKWNTRLDIKSNNSLVNLMKNRVAATEKVGAGIDKLALAAIDFNQSSERAVRENVIAIGRSLEALSTSGEFKKINEDKKQNEYVVTAQHAALRVQVKFHKGDIEEGFENTTKAVRRLGLKFMVNSEDASKFTEGTYKTGLNKSDLESVCKEAKEVAYAMRVSKVEKTFSAASRDRLIGFLNANKTDDKEEAKLINDHIKMVRATFSTVSSIGTTIEAETGNVAKAALDCVAAHI